LDLIVAARQHAFYYGEAGVKLIDGSDRLDYFWRQTAFILLLGCFLEPPLAASHASELGKVLSLPA
jgi:hypothetical protein